MLGAFVDGTLAGFAGFHGEGSIGLLEVLPAYRRRGLGGSAAPGGRCSLALERGQYAFGQVLIDNAPSLALPEKGGHDPVGAAPVLAVPSIKSRLNRPEAFNRPF